MPVSVVVGGQFGSEGKGKVAAWLALEQEASMVVRCGGTNSGHTVYSAEGENYIFRQLPTAAIYPDITCVLTAGTYIDLDVLNREIALFGITADRLRIDPNAVIIEPGDKKNEQDGLVERIGSTGSGTGAALRRRISREDTLRQAGDIPELAVYLEDTRRLFASSLANGERLVVEGTQGYGLSVLHSAYYPYVTSRDTTAAGFLSESGISPLHVDNIYLVIRSFPIRVAGDSGDLPNEISWSQLTQESGYVHDLVEHTSVTKAVRRVGRFDASVVSDAILANAPTHVVMNHLDYIRKENRAEFIATVESQLGRIVDYIGLGPDHIAQYSFGTDRNLHVV